MKCTICNQKLNEWDNCQCSTKGLDKETVALLANLKESIYTWSSWEDIKQNMKNLEQSLKRSQ